MRRAAIGLLLGTLIAALADSSSLAASLPGPTGPFAVGRRVLRWTDVSRREVLSASPADTRGVVAWIWYPAAPSPAGKPAAYVDALDRVAKGLTRAETSLARKGVTHALDSVAPAGESSPWPIVLFSPGSGMLPALYTTFAEELASHGYVVVGIDHPYDDRAVLLSDGRVVSQAKQPSGGEELLRFERERVGVRTADLRFALDQMTRIERGELADSLSGHLDLSQVGVFGHSVGGMTAAQFCQEDTRVRACGNLDGVVAAMPAYVEAGRGMDRPFLFIQKPFPAMRGESALAAEQRVGRLMAKGDVVLEGVRAGRSYRVTVADATHDSFSDLEVLTKDSKRHQHLLLLIRDHLRAFFDCHLKGETSTLLDREPVDRAVQVRRFDPR